MMIGKHKKFRDGILAMLATSTLICSSAPVAQGIISKEEHEQLVKDGKFDFRNNYDEASQNLAKMKCEDRIEGWGSIKDGKNSYAPSDVMWVRPTKEEMKSFTEVSWSDPGDYEYLVDTFPEGKRPKLMKATTTGRYFIQSTIPNWDPDKPKEEYYRQFKPEHYLPKEYAENVPVKIIKEDGKPVSAIVDDEIQNPDFYINRKMEDVKVDPKSGTYKIVAKPEFYIGQEATIAERIAYFSKHPEIYEIYDVSDVDSIPRDKGDLDRTRRILGSSPDMLWHSIPGVGWGAYDDEGNEIGESCLFPLVIKNLRL